MWYQWSWTLMDDLSSVQLKCRGGPIIVSEKKGCHLCHNTFSEPDCVCLPGGTPVHTHCATQKLKGSPTKRQIDHAHTSNHTWTLQEVKRTAGGICWSWAWTTKGTWVDTGVRTEREGGRGTRMRTLRALGFRDELKHGCGLGERQNFHSSECVCVWGESEKCTVCWWNAIYSCSLLPIFALVPQIMFSWLTGLGNKKMDKSGMVWL